MRRADGLASIAAAAAFAAALASCGESSSRTGSGGESASGGAAHGGSSSTSGAGEGGGGSTSSGGANAGGGGSAPACPAPDPSWLHVKDYGAVGDGAADDRPAIQAALDAAKGMTGGATVYFDPGTYLLATSTAPGSQLIETSFGTPFSISLIGKDATLTTSVTDDAGVALLHAQGFWQDATVCGLTFVNTHGIVQSSTVAIELEGTGANAVRNWTIENSTFKNFSTFIETSGVTGAVIDDNDFVMEQGRDSGSSSYEALPNVGIWMFDNSPQGISEDIRITHNRYRGCGDLSDLSSTVSKSCGDGLAFGRSIGSLVQENAIQGFSAEAIFLIDEPTAGAGTTVTGNTIDGTRIPGDMFGGGLWAVRADASNSVVEHNVIKNAVTGIFSCSATFCGGSGTAHTGIVIRDNEISTEGSGDEEDYAGIQVIGISSSKITDNTLSFGSGAVKSGGEAYGIQLSSGGVDSGGNALIVTGNALKNGISGHGGEFAGIFMQRLSSFTVTGNTVTGFTYGFDFDQEPGTPADLQALLSANMLHGNGQKYRAQNGSF